MAEKATKISAIVDATITEPRLTSLLGFETVSGGDERAQLFRFHGTSSL